MIKDRDNASRCSVADEAFLEMEYIDEFLFGELSEEAAETYLNAIHADRRLLDRLVDAVEVDTLLLAKSEKAVRSRVSRTKGTGGIRANGKLDRTSFRIALCVVFWICCILSFYASSRYVVSLFEPSFPADYPSLTNCTIRILQDGRPLEGAYVTLYPHNKSLRVACGGTSDRNGMARMMTNGFLKGVPDAEFHVTVSKIVVETGERIEAYFVVDPRLVCHSTTPLRCQVEQGKDAHFRFDVGTKERIPIELRESRSSETHRFGDHLFTFCPTTLEHEVTDP